MSESTVKNDPFKLFSDGEVQKEVTGEEFRILAHEQEVLTRRRVSVGGHPNIWQDQTGELYEVLPHYKDKGATIVKLQESLRDKLID